MAELASGTLHSYFRFSGVDVFSSIITPLSFSPTKSQSAHGIFSVVYTRAVFVGSFPITPCKAGSLFAKFESSIGFPSDNAKTE